MTCSGCNTHNEVHRRYCSNCGTRIHHQCPRCGFGNGFTDRFCGGCADGLTAADAQSAPATATLPKGASASSDPGEVLSSKDLEELLHRPLPPAAPALSSKVSQSELDKLFGTPT